MRKQLRCVIVEPSTNIQLCTGIQVNVPESLTPLQAVDYVTGVIAHELGRYAVWEALGLNSVDSDAGLKIEES